MSICLLLLACFQHQDITLENGLKINTLLEGSGVPLLLIGGLGSRIQAWDSVAPALSEHFTVIRFDNRGIGKSGDLPGQPYSLATMAEDAAALMAVLGYDRYHVAGISLGSFAAQRLALDHPDRVIKLVLIASSLGGSQHVAPGQEVLGFFMTMATMERAESVDKGLRLSLHPDFIESRPDHFAALVQSGIAYVPPATTIQRQMMVGMMFNHAEQARQIKVPTLLIHGTDDKIVPAANSERLHQAIPESTLALITEAGHLCIVDQAKTVIAEMRVFLK